MLFPLTAYTSDSFSKHAHNKVPDTAHFQKWKQRILISQLLTKSLLSNFIYNTWNIVQKWDEETHLGQSKGHRATQTTTVLGGEGERGTN